uniref:DDE Tnp4 domain-containing protein n=1 Tax=Ditylenchus dipsaci TaxID=166011 RepID=A0A915DTI9_9BILA
MLSNRKKIALLLYLRQRNRKRSCWIHPMNVRRAEVGAFVTTMPDLKKYPEKCLKYIRMDITTFYKLLEIVKPSITHVSIRVPVSSEERLMVTLRFLATGESYSSLSYSYRLGISTISDIVRETCEAIYNNLRAKYLAIPRKEAEWAVISREFWHRWQVPMVLGAIDGKHVVMKKPANSGSLYYNYKGSCSIVIMACVDAKYRCLMCDFGSYGHNGDAGIYDGSDFKQALDENTLDLPKPDFLPGTETLLNYHFLGDGAFPLSERMMKPFPGYKLSKDERIFNYRTSRGRRVVENFFGILAATWRCLLWGLEVKEQNADWIIKATVVLHNFLLDEMKGKTGDLSDLADTGMRMMDYGEI